MGRPRTFWQQQKAGKEEELRTGEASLGVLQAKADAVRQAKENFERATADSQAKEQALEEAGRAAGEAKRIQEEAANIAKATSPENEDI